MSFKNYSIDNTNKIIKNQEKKQTTQTTSTWKPQKTESIQKAGSLGYAPKIVSTPKTPRVTLSDLGKNSGFNTVPALNEGARIKNEMKSLIPKMNIGIPSTIVDDIDDKTVENNISLANEALELNKRNKVYKDFMKEYPYFADAMTMAYAFDDIGNKSAVNAFKKIAYEKPENIPEPKISGITPWHKIPPAQNEKKPEIKGQDKEIFPAVVRSEIEEDIARRFPKKKVTADSLNIRSKPGFSGGINGSFLNGEEITVDMDSAVKADGYTWVKIKVDGKEGWVASEYLEDVKQAKKPETKERVENAKPEEDSEKTTTNKDNEAKETNNKTNNAPVSQLLPSPNDKPSESVEKPDWLKDPEPLDPKALQEAFNNVGDFDGHEGLQCPDIVKWFLNEYTTVKPDNPKDEIITGNGGDIVGNLEAKYGIPSTTTPCAPAIFSVAPGTYGPGFAEGDVSDKDAGHTGIVLECKSLGNGKYELTYIHTYSGLDENGYNSAIRTKIFDKSDNVTYSYIGDKTK